jgi:hypothetical protein
MVWIRDAWSKRYDEIVFEKDYPYRYNKEPTKNRFFIFPIILNLNIIGGLGTEDFIVPEKINSDKKTNKGNLGEGVEFQTHSEQ